MPTVLRPGPYRVYCFSREPLGSEKVSGTPKQRSNWKVYAIGYGIHWPDLDEDLSTEGFIASCAGTGEFGTSPNKPLQATAKCAPRLSAKRYTPRSAAATLKGGGSNG